MIFLFQSLPFLLPLNQTFPCHNGLVPLSIADTSRILDVEIEDGGLTLHPKKLTFLGYTPNEVKN
jgi:hypothetical protein